jgi:UDP-3-O-[3-hydroxymyristoyl] N-acetylglucosamine deacetylase/3-hydroxyacyl-[acyl-carrier-protein] dehydratase
MIERQTTLGKKVSIDGQGLHTGKKGTMSFLPAPAGHGIKFKRIDLEGQPVIDALIGNVISTNRGTCIGKDTAHVYTIEHVMAAFRGLCVDNALVELDMEETPIKDGSSKYFVEAIEEAGIVELDAEREYIVIEETITMEIPEKKTKIEIRPSKHFSATTIIDFESRVLGEQTAEIQDISEFKAEISSCRTFVFLHELEFLLKNDLIKGGDLNNAIVFVNRKVPQDELDYLADLFKKPRVTVNGSGILNNLSLYFDNEPARHKLLDIIGDLYLLGKPLKGHVTATRPGHHANTEFAKHILKEINQKAIVND